MEAVSKTLRAIVAKGDADAQKQAELDVEATLADWKYWNHEPTYVEEHGWLFTGMRTHLHHFQMQGVLAMLKKEKSGKAKGGLMGDEMGLGKTIQLIALVCQDAGSDEHPMATLLIVPPNIRVQIMDQIRLHCEPNISKRCIAWRDWPSQIGQIEQTTDKKLSPTEQRKRIQQKYMVVATQHEVRQATFPTTLHWRRLVIDEANVVSEMNTRLHEVLSTFTSTYTWLLTGTPFRNESQSELYAYLKILRFPGLQTWTYFEQKHRIGEEDGQKLLHDKYHHILIRRTKADTFLGHSIATTPPAHSSTIFLKMDPLTQLVHDLVLGEMRIHAKMPGKGKLNELTAIQQLRRLVNHTGLELGLISQFVKAPQIEEIKAKALEEQDLHLSAHMQRITNMMNMISLKLEAGKETDSVDGIEDDYEPKAIDWISDVQATDDDSQVDDVPRKQSRRLGAGHGMEPDSMTYFMQTANLTKWECTICDEESRSRHATLNCGHAAHWQCWLDIQNSPRQKKSQAYSCTVCGAAVKFCKQDSSLRKRGPATKTKNKITKGQTAKNSWWFSAESTIVWPSAKSIAFKALMLHSIEVAPDDKFLVFSEHKDVLRIIEVVCNGEGWEYVKFTGEENPREKENAIAAFNEPLEDGEGIRLMLLTSPSGGTGLTLTAANRVILLDPWWNQAMEDQCCARVARIGQTKECFLTRFFVDCPVERHMYEVQQYKNRRIEAVTDGTELYDANTNMQSCTEFVFGRPASSKRKPANAGQSAGSSKKCKVKF